MLTKIFHSGIKLFSRMKVALIFSVRMDSIICEESATQHLQMQNMIPTVKHGNSS